MCCGFFAVAESFAIGGFAAIKFIGIIRCFSGFGNDGSAGAKNQRQQKKSNPFHGFKIKQSNLEKLKRKMKHFPFKLFTHLQYYKMDLMFCLLIKSSGFRKCNRYETNNCKLSKASFTKVVLCVFFMFAVFIIEFCFLQIAWLKIPG